MKKFIHSPSFISIWVIGIITIIVTTNINWNPKSWDSILETDAKGYYSYLPAAIVYQDANIGFFDEMEGEKYYNETFYYEYRTSTEDNKVYPKYYIGTAVAEAPLYLMTHFMSFFSDFESDGYARPYALSVTLSAIAYLLIGLFFLRKTLLLYEINEWIITFIIVTMAFGTNTFYYTIVEPGMSHIYAFAFMSGFIFYTKSYFKNFSVKPLLLLALCLGFAIIIRPTNVLIILSIPFIAGNKELFAKGITHLFKKWPYLLLAFSLTTSIVFIQLVYYKIATGDFIIYSYAQEGFDFLSPNMFNILFSYKKGLFLYTPVYFVCVLSSLFLFRNNKFEAISFLGFFLLITYIFSSWWMWYYGASFSSRVYVEYLPLIILPLAFMLQKLSENKAQKVIGIVIITLVLICQIQTYQYRYEHIHYSEMTKEKYWDSFLRIDRLIK